MVESFLTIIGPVKLTEASTLIEGFQRTHEADLPPLWAEVDSSILWKFLVKYGQVANELQIFIMTSKKTLDEVTLHAFTSLHALVCLPTMN